MKEFKMKKVKAVIFDFNGTMIFDSPIHESVWVQYLKENGADPGTRDEYAKHLFGCSNRHILTHYLGELSDETIEKMAYEKEWRYRQRCMQDETAFRLVGGLCDYLDFLKSKNIPITIATGSEINNVTFYFNSEKLNLARWFDKEKIVYDDDTFRGKPAPDIFLKAAEKLGIDSQDCAVFEDSLSGVMAAHNARAGAVIGIGGTPEEKFIPFGGVDKSYYDFSEWKDFPLTYDK